MSWQLFVVILSVGQLQLQVRGEINSGKLCQRIASQCRSSCQTFWDECHDQASPVLINPPPDPASSPSLSSTTEFESTIVPIILGHRECALYRDPCDGKHRCCRPYNCRYHPDGSGMGLCF
ncbi:unnamed protein product [Allacma fusca]|uniref:WAP domain-containing protein n=1 Tax=Allacma fusca TaxID=39272 RepID=A0A8J2K8G9_9HEXA|nr:unnamed protein product [Allacma fusca]